MTTGRAVIIGATIAVVVIAAIAGLALTGVLGDLPKTSGPVDGPVIVALVLPDESGVQEPRVIDAYTRTPSGWSIASVSPSLRVVVSGTTGKTLADAYVYGGGAALARAYSSLGRGEAESWVVIDPAAWSSLAGTTPISVDVPSALEVFDGSRLLSFPSGRQAVAPAQVALLLVGSEYLPAAQNAAVRGQVGDAMGEMLARASASQMRELKSDLREQRLAQWLGTLRSRLRGSGD